MVAKLVISGSFREPLLHDLSDVLDGVLDLLLPVGGRNTDAKIAGHKDELGVWEHSGGFVRGDVDKCGRGLAVDVAVMSSCLFSLLTGVTDSADWITTFNVFLCKSNIMSNVKC